jgi:hypothetical protein
MYVFAAEASPSGVTVSFDSRLKGETGRRLVVDILIFSPSLARYYPVTRWFIGWKLSTEQYTTIASGQGDFLVLSSIIIYVIYQYNQSYPVC